MFLELGLLPRDHVVLDCHRYQVLLHEPGKGTEENDLAGESIQAIPKQVIQFVICQLLTIVGGVVSIHLHLKLGIEEADVQCGEDRHGLKKCHAIDHKCYNKCSKRDCLILTLLQICIVPWQVPAVS